MCRPSSSSRRAAGDGSVVTESGPAEWASIDERHALAESVRRLLDAVVTTGASPAELSTAAAAIEQVAASLARSVVRQDIATEPDSYRAHMSLVSGPAHPVAPQLTLERTQDGAVGDVVVGPVFQGGPGLVHGGIIALLIDHAMGFVANRSDRPAMTVQLTLRYRRPTPLGVPLTVTARLDRIEGRKLHLSASITARGQLTAQADAIFLRLTADNVERVFAQG
jgi:acyl-coenzyme A thioesterase PaaI-like protein